MFFVKVVAALKQKIDLFCCNLFFHSVILQQNFINRYIR